MQAVLLYASHCPVKFSRLKFRNLFFLFPLSFTSEIYLPFGRQKGAYDGKRNVSLLFVWESQRAKEKSLLCCLLIHTFTQGFYDRLLSRGVCDNMPTKGNVRRITSTTPYDIIQKAVLRKNTGERKSGRFRKRFSAKLRFALVFRSAF